MSCRCRGKRIVSQREKASPEPFPCDLSNAICDGWRGLNEVAGARVWAFALPELTSGVRDAARALPLPWLAGLLSFGGFCAHCQVLPTLQKLRLRYGVFLLFRLAHALLSALVCRGLCPLFRVERAVFAGRAAAFAPSAASSEAVSVCLVCMCALLLLGSDTIVKCYA